MRGALRRVGKHEGFRRAAGPGVALALLAAAGYLALKLTPDWFASDRFPDRRCVLGERSYRDCLDTAKARADDRQGVTTATLAIFAGFLATIGAYYTHRTFGLNRAGQITERFTRAIDQLGSKELDVRLGGIYALERIARDSRSDHPQIVEVLTAYVREHAPWPPKSSSATTAEQGAETFARPLEAIRAVERTAKGTEPEMGPAGPSSGPAPSEGEDEPLRPPTDVQAAMTVLGRRELSHDRRQARPSPQTPAKLTRDEPQVVEPVGRRVLNLARTDLRGLVLTPDETKLEGADLRGANLQRARLGRANLQGALLGGANLQGAELFGGNLHGALLGRANLQGALLGRSNLQGAELTEAKLEGANLIGANLEDANLNEAKLEGARLGTLGRHRTNLEGANLGDANLQNADLRRANLPCVQLGRANLQGAHLYGANLWGAALGGANLKGAILGDANLQRARLGGANLEGADLGGANLEGAYLGGANLQGARLAREAEVRGLVSEANLQGTRYDAETTWPDGFDPVAAGALRLAEAEAPGSVPPPD